MTILSFFEKFQQPNDRIKRAAKASLAICALTTTTYSASTLAVDVDPEKSIFIRDLATLNQFSLTETLQKLIESTGDFGNTPQSILDTWPNTTNMGCSFTNSMNGFPFSCTSSLGLASEFETIAITNRFDLASENGADCGEYRIAFAHTETFTRSSLTTFMIFESRLPNPTPQSGLEGCRPVAEFWANLSLIHNANERATQLRNFYLHGLPGFSPVISAENYRGEENGSGQIRFNQRSADRGVSWQFFEFRTQPTPGNLSLVVSTLKDTPPTTIFSENTPADVFQKFEDGVIEGLLVAGKNLLANDMSSLDYDPDNTINIGSIGAGSGDAAIGFDRLKSRFDNQSEFANTIQTQLNAVGSSLSPDQVIARVESLSCAGCHSQSADLGSPINFTSNGQNQEMLSMVPEIGDMIHIEAESFTEMSGVQTEVTSDEGGGLNVGWLDAGDWMIFDAVLPPSTTGQYRIQLRVAGEFTGSLALERPGGSEVWEVIQISSTTGWQSWRTITRVIQIPAGETQFAIAVLEGGWNINWIKIESLGGEKMQLKDALKNSFIPEREANLESFLNNACSNSSCLDSDNDGVNDNIDQCPNTPQGTSVDANGCPIPTGGNCDGVTPYPTWLHNDYEGGPNTHLLSGELMQHNNQLFQANWYTSSLPGSDASWTSLGSCD